MSDDDDDTYSYEESWDESGSKTFSSLGDSSLGTSELRDETQENEDKKRALPLVLKKQKGSFTGQLWVDNSENRGALDVSPRVVGSSIQRNSMLNPGLHFLENNDNPVTSNRGALDVSPRVVGSSIQRNSMLNPGLHFLENNDNPVTSNLRRSSSIMRESRESVGVEDSRKINTPKKMHVHFSNTLEIVHDIRDSPPEFSDSGEISSEDSSDRTDTSTSKSLTDKYTNDFDSLSGKSYSADFESSTAKSYSSDFEQTFSEDTDTYQSISQDQETSQLNSQSVFSDSSDTYRNVSDSESYTDSQYSDISSLSDDRSDATETGDDLYSDTFESATKTSGRLSSSYRYDDDTFEDSDTSSIKHSILDSLVFPDLSDIETTDVTYARDQFVAETIYKLKHPDIKLDFHLADDKPKTESKKDRILSEYCQMKIDQLKSKQDKPEEKTMKLKPDPIPVETYGIGTQQVERLKLQNFMMKLKQKCEEEIHDINTCPDCRSDEIDGALQEKEFIKRIKQKVESEIMEDKIQKHLIEMNSVNLIAKIIREIPKLSDDSRETIYTYKQKVQQRFINS
ncbi:dentin sialophosphoprotein isoform X2 [Patella vulgata]|uniref:dentin sialophosphoprotein isoform X2 n=1 Tax=Patella vulgata TaxID=6465 RepID=UPI0024A9B8FC|nr:dentin sialophosphoprotein isoform X2 [Patella vulgata]